MKTIQLSDHAYKFMSEWLAEKYGSESLNFEGWANFNEVLAAFGVPPRVFTGLDAYYYRNTAARLDKLPETASTGGAA